MISYKITCVFLVLNSWVLGFHDFEDLDSVDDDDLDYYKGYQNEGPSMLNKYDDAIRVRRFQDHSSIHTLSPEEIRGAIKEILSNVDFNLPFTPNTQTNGEPTMTSLPTPTDTDLETTDPNTVTEITAYITNVFTQLYQNYLKSIPSRTPGHSKVSRTHYKKFKNHLLTSLKELNVKNTILMRQNEETTASVMTDAAVTPEPAEITEPIAATESDSITKPTLTAEPLPKTEPIATPKPDATTEQVVSSDPIDHQGPTAKPESTGGTENESPSVKQPIVTKESVATHTKDPVTTEYVIPTKEPVPIDETVDTKEPADATKLVASKSSVTTATDDSYEEETTSRKTTKRRRTRKTTTTTTTPRTTRSPLLDVPRLLDIIADLASEFETNLTRKLNETLVKMSIPTCTTPTTEPTVTSEYDSNYTGATIAKCFVCGLDIHGIPQHAHCADAFAGDFLPLVPVDPTAKGRISTYRKYCKYSNIPKYQFDPQYPRAIYGRWTGGCSVRWIDLSGIYTQRSCRNRMFPTVGKHYASKRMAKLERTLWNLEDGCITSPMATLVPLSRAISLYARFHACVCTGSWCNTASNNQQWSLFVILQLIMAIYVSIT